VLELLKGSDLARVLDEQGALPIEDAVDYCLQALEALAEAHSLGIVHRDLKPANLFLAQREKGPPMVKVLDFGISKLIGTEKKRHGDPVTDSRALLGSPSYMSPEQVRSSKHIDARSDIWSMGVILYRLLAKQPPFEGDNLGTVLAAILEATPTPIKQYCAEVPEALEQVILRCLDRNRDTRFQSVDELAEALMPFAPPKARYSLDRIRSTLGAVSRRPSAIAATLPASDPPPEPGGGKTAESWSESQRVKRPGSSRLALIAAAALAVIAGLVVVAVRGSSPAPNGSAHEEAARASAATPNLGAAAPTAAPSPTVSPVVSVEPVAEEAPAASVASAAPATAAKPPSSARPRTPVRPRAPAKAKSGVDDSVLYNRK